MVKSFDRTGTHNEIGSLDRRLVYVLGAVLLVVTALVFSQVAGFKLLMWDDDQHIVENEYFNPLTWRGLLHFWGYSYIYMYIPISYDFWGFEVWLSRFFPSSDPADHFNPAVFHLGNLLIHLANVTLVYWLLLRLARHAPAAFCGALLFAVHPLQTESVCWVGETRGTLAAFFSLSALQKYLDYVGIDPRRGVFVDEAYVPPQRRRRDYVWATLLYCFALLSKPSAMTWPAIVFVVEMLLLRGSWKTSLRRLALWFVAAAIIAGLTKYYQKTEYIAATSITKWSERPLLIGDTYAFYLRKLVWPSEPTFDYGHTPLKAARSPYYSWNWILPVAVLGLLLLDRKRRRLWLGAFAFFVLAIAPVSGVVPFLYQSISTVADRYMYVPLIGFGLMLAVWLATSRTRWGYLLAMTLLTIAAWRTYEQTGIWRDDRIVFGNGLQVTPDSFIAHLTLGNKLRNKKQNELAMTHYRRVLEIRPDLFIARSYIGDCLYDLERFDEAAAEYRTVVEGHLDDFHALRGLGRALAALGRNDEARETFERALKQTKPDSKEATEVRTELAKLDSSSS